MPTILFPLTYLSRLTEATPAQLEQQAFDYGLEATLKGDALEVEVTAERPDLLAAEGFTRAINIYNGRTRSIPDTLEPSDRTITIAASVANLRPYISGIVVENIDLGQDGLAALIQFQEKITQTFGRQRQKIAIGVYHLDLIQGNLLYTTAHKDELAFVPLHSPAASDPLSDPLSEPVPQDTTPAPAMTAREILAHHPNGLLYAHTLPDGDFVPVLQDSAGTVLSLPPIINAAGIGHLTAAVKNLFIDVTGISPKTVLETVNMLVHNFLDMGAQVKTVAIQSENPEIPAIMPDLTRRSIDFSAKFLNQIVGTAILKTDLNRYLSRMDLFATGTGEILVPSYRTDIFSAIDVAGDLLVAVGISNLSADFSALRFYTGKSDPLKDFTYEVSDLAQRMGLMEVKSFVLADPELLTWFSDNWIQSSNAKSRTHSAARTTLQAGLLEILSRNINAAKPINIYEIGDVLSFAPTGEISETLCWSFASLDAKASFATAKSYLQTILKAFEIEYQLLACPERRYLPGRAATICVNGTAVGHFGEIHPEILHHFSFPEPVCSGELDCRQLYLDRQSAT